MFKSTNGGVSWTNITPTIPAGQSPWGCYFLNPNYGVFLVGGCTSHQYFFRTTDAGANWIIYEDSVANSGLTDVILQNNGYGRAASSGRIWETNDSGKIWTVMCTSGPNVWNEELSWYSNTMLIPTAGTLCNGGGGGGGGARITLDNGNTWNYFNTGVVMYGTFLLNSNTGWICGDNRSVWYTSDGGTNWALRNCGLEGNFDDLWFVNDSVGFVVGSGVYKIGPNQRTITKTSMNFGSACPPIEKYDTLWVKNKSWYGVGATFQLVGADASHYSVIQPTSSSMNIGSCDSVRFIVKFQPTTGGTKNASLQVTLIPDGTIFTVSLTGSLRGSSVVVPNDTLVIVNNVKVGNAVTLSTVWNNSSTFTDQITLVQKQSGDDIYTLRTLPIDIPPGGVRVDFTTTPTDTGWTTSRYLFRISPCDRDTFITFKVYGISPIINSINRLQLQSKCKSIDVDSIPVSNTGNDDLRIDNVIFNPGSNDVSILGWNTNEPYPIIIKRGETKYIKVQFAPTLGGARNIRLQINNNDLTTSHQGIKNPWFVSIEALSEVPVITQADTVIDFGEVCVGSKREMTTDILNKGIVASTIDGITVLHALPEFTVSTVTSLPVTITAGDKTPLNISFSPKTSGEVIDSIRIQLQPCGVEKFIRVRGVGITTAITANPTNISAVVKTATTKTFDVEVTSTGSADAIISNITLLPANPDWKISKSPQLPFTLSPTNKVTVTVELTPTKDNQQFDGQLCFEVSGKCPTALCVPVSAKSTNSEIVWDKTSLNFGLVRCVPKVSFDTLTITNKGSDVDTLLSANLIQSGTSFSIISPTQFPVSIIAGSPVQIIVRAFKQTEGTENAQLTFSFAKMFAGALQQIPLSAEFRKTAIATTDTFRDFGVVETCSPDSTYTVRFTNSGSIDESLTVARFTSAKEFTLNTQTLTIPAGGTATAIITFSPKNSTVGKVFEKFIWTGSICTTSVAIDVQAEIVAPELIISPTTLPFGDVWQDTIKILTFTVTDTSQYPRELISLDVVDGDGTAFTTDFVPQTVVKGKPVTFTVTFKPQKTGAALAHVSIKEKSVCEKTTVLEFSANVPTEFYFGQLQVGNDKNSGLYSVYVNDTTTIPFYLTTNNSSNTALWKTTPTAITVNLEYDAHVMEIQELYTLKATQKIVQPFIHTNSGVQVTIQDTSVSQLGATDTLFYATVRGMQNVPNSTDVHISKPVTLTMPKVKPYQIDTKDGLFNVESCVSWAQLKLAESFHMVIIKQPSSDYIPLSLVTNSPQDVEFTVVDVLGNTVTTHKATISGTQSTIQISTDGIASGTYFIIATNNSGITQRERVVIEK